MFPGFLVNIFKNRIVFLYLGCDGQHHEKEDDGGKQTSWECTALVRIESKSYGIEIDLPFKTRDDIVWRGSLSARYLEAHSNVPENFGDVTVTFEIEEL